ncbi:MAG: hypothetical protein AAF810_06120 [Cyanobacteria bacterium P01_D01_bin.36]
MNYIQVLEGAEADAAIAQLGTLVTLTSSEEGSPNVALRKQEGVVVAPVIHKGTLTPEILEKIFTAANTTGHSSMKAIGLYSEEEQHCYEVPMSLEALSELRGTSCGVINFALFAAAPEAETPDWLVIFDDQLYIAYGPEAFVNELVGSVDSAYKAVEERLNQLYTESLEDIPGYAVQEINRMGEYLDTAFIRLSKDYAEAAVGERVAVV